MADTEERAEEKEVIDQEVQESEETETPSKSPETKDTEVKEEEETKVENEEEAVKVTDKVTENGGDEKESSEQGTSKEEKEEEKVKEEEKEPAKETAEGHGTTVAKHYNEHPENTREERRGSRIFYLRNFNNWIKSVLINEVLEKIKKKNHGDITVLDLACGKGGDLLKWQKGKVSNLICADIADVSMKQCSQRYKDMQKNRHSRRYQDPLFDIQFITADCTKEDLNDQYNEKNKDIMFDMTSCQFALHYSFESQEQAEKMLENCCEKIKPGGYFIGTVPCANELVKRLRESEDMSFGNEVYSVTFTEKEEFPLFGHKYNFHLDGVVDCPEFLVHFPMLEKMAEKFDMKLEFTKGFHDFFHEHLTSYKSLMYRMQALETYPPKRDNDRLTSSEEDAYSEAKDFLDGAKSGSKEEADPKYRDHRNKGANHVGTLSKDEWEAVGIYMVFAFKKAEAETPMEEEKSEESEEKKEAAEVGGDDEKKEEDEKMEDDGKKEEEDKKDEDEKEDEDKKDEEDKKGEEEKKEDEEEKEDDENKEEEEKTEEDENEEEEDKKEDEGKKEEGEEGTEAVEMEAEPAEEVKVTTPRATRKRRSVGKDEAAKKTEEELETKPKRETRKRKSTGGTTSAEEEPPEKKKA